MNGIDPLLYRSDSQVERWQRYYNQNKGTNFQKLLEEKRLKKNVSPEVSSSLFNQVPDKNAVLAHADGHPERLKLYEAAKEFEAFFIEKMFREMKKNVPKNKLFHGGRAEEIFDEMLLSERVRGLSDNTHFGLAEMMYKQLQHNQQDLTKVKKSEKAENSGSNE